jgi:VWFA-related protein
MRSRFLPCLAGVLVASLAWVLASQEPQPAKPAFRSDIDLVTVDVTVLGRDGTPLAELGPEDFTVKVDGTPRTIASLRIVRVDEPGEAAPTDPSQAPANARLFMIVVDRDHIPAGEGRQMLDAATRFVDALPPNDRVAFWAIPSSTGGLRFATDRAAIKKDLRSAVGTYRPPLIGGLPGRAQFNVSAAEALLIDQGRRDVLEIVTARECPSPSAAPVDPDAPLTGFQTCPDFIPDAARTVAADARQRAEVTLTAIGNLIQAVSRIDAPKHLLLITSGPVNSNFDEQGFIDLVAAQAAAARVTVHALQVLEAPASARTDSMRRPNMPADQSLSASYFLAGMTGGLAITPSSGDVAFGQLTRQLSVSYELAFEPTPEDRDGEAHKIEVGVADRGWGSTVRARKTFRVDPMAMTRGPSAVPLPPPAARASAGEPAETDEPADEAPVPAVASGPGSVVITSSGMPVGTDIDSMTGALAAYVARFEQTYAAVVAQERYVQIIHPWRGTPKGPESEPGLAWQEPGAPKKGGPTIARRQLVSDVLLVQVKDRDWMGFRDVAEVDGDAVRDRADRVRALFVNATPDSLMQLRRIADESSRYNLGDLRRTLNTPTVALSFMRQHELRRYQFKKLKDEVIAGRPARVLSYLEKVRPALIQTPDGLDIFIYGRIWLDAENGRVLRTELRFDLGGERRSVIRVDFHPEPGIDILVPTAMWEWYEGANQLGRIGGDKTLVQGLATYSDFKRFQVSTTEEVK